MIDEAAMKVITDNLVDPWHRTFARDVVEIYLKHSNKHTVPNPWANICKKCGRELPHEGCIDIMKELATQKSKDKSERINREYCDTQRALNQLSTKT